MSSCCIQSRKGKWRGTSEQILPNMIESQKRPQGRDGQSRVDLERQSGWPWKRGDDITG